MSQTETHMTPEELRSAREFLCLQQKELAALYGYSTVNRISNYETGSRPVPKLLAFCIQRDLRIRKIHHIIDAVLAREHGIISSGARDALEDARAICNGVSDSPNEEEQDAGPLMRIEPMDMNGRAPCVQDGDWVGHMTTEGQKRLFYVIDTRSGHWFRYDIDPRTIAAREVILKQAIALARDMAS